MRRLAAVLLASVLVATACGGAPVDPGDTAPVTLELEIGPDGLVGGARRAEAPLGARVRLVLSGSSPERVHVHGYDLFATVADGELVFDALIPGVFEIELEESATLLIQLEIS